MEPFDPYKALYLHIAISRLFPTKCVYCGLVSWGLPPHYCGGLPVWPRSASYIYPYYGTVQKLPTPVHTQPRRVRRKR